MKTTELMLGDYVCLERDTECNSPLRVESLTIANNMVNTSDEEWWYGEYIIPIPITEEMLWLNGIKNLFGRPWYQRYNGHYQIVYETDLGTQMRILVDYVHELQHALRLCGLNELADNWKVG